MKKGHSLSESFSFRCDSELGQDITREDFPRKKNKFVNYMVSDDDLDVWRVN